MGTRPDERNGVLNDLGLVAGFTAEFAAREGVANGNYGTRTWAAAKAKSVIDQVIDVSDADRALAFANIEKAANYYNVNLAERAEERLSPKAL